MSQINKSKKKQKAKIKNPKNESDATRSIIQDMNKYKNAEDLNENIIKPFINALSEVCNHRGYILNIYGNNCNLAITPENHAENLFRIINKYLDDYDIG